jgi:poly-beta-1,6-N-acetyl-D-glucosamine N-deacetylase
MKRSPVNFELIVVLVIIALTAWLMVTKPVPAPNLTAVPPAPADQAAAPAAVYYTDQIAVLTYHNLDPLEGPSTISPTRFEEQIAVMQSHGYNFITLDQLKDFLAGKDAPPNAVLITFDDGYKGVFQYAYPIMSAKKIPGVVFLIVSKIGQSINQIPKLDWAQIKAMQAQSLTFQSHSFDSHHNVNRQDGTQGPALTTPQYVPVLHRGETASEYQTRVENDLRQAKAVIENQLPTTVDSFCLPYGVTNPIVQQAALTAGYRYIFTVNEGMVKKDSDPLSLNRINAGQIGMDGESLHTKIISLVK